MCGGRDGDKQIKLTGAVSPAVGLASQISLSHLRYRTREEIAESIRGNDAELSHYLVLVGIFILGC